MRRKGWAAFRKRKFRKAGTIRKELIPQTNLAGSDPGFKLPFLYSFQLVFYFFQMFSFFSPIISVFLKRTVLLAACAALFLGQAPLATAQAPGKRINDVNQHAWLMYFGAHKLSEKVGIHTEAQVRRARVLRDWQQLLLRTGVNYFATPNAMLTLGYAYVDTYPYGDFPAASIFPEHRLYEQLQLYGSAGRFGFVHRYRLEQRWVRFPNAAESTYLNRARYMFRATFPLQGPTIDNKEFYLAAYDEIFVGFGKHMAHNFFDQNRLYGAVGYKFNPRVLVELGYLNQIVQQRNGQIFEHNHTLQAALYYSFDFSRRD
jgi:hypothetical protein